MRCRLVLFLVGASMVWPASLRAGERPQVTTPHAGQNSKTRIRLEPEYGLLCATTAGKEKKIRQKPNPATNEQSKVSQSAVVTKALATSFGPALEPVTGFRPFYLTGDFNGDGMPDLLVVVLIKRRRSELPKDVRVLNPFYNDRSYGPNYPTDPAAKPTLAFAVIHGTKAGWKTSESAGKFLLVGPSPILIMEYDREKSDPNGGIELKRKRSTPRKGGWPPAAAKGDSIYLPTEGSDSILYWNGTTYRWEEGDEP
jgi:hypothetical protein